MTRKSIYTDELGEKIFELLCAPLSISKISRMEGMPSKFSIVSWGNDESHPFSKLYDMAFKIRADIFADECIDIADDDSNDLDYDNQGRAKINREFYERSKLRCQERHWAAAVMNRKRYGDKVSAELSGQDGVPLIPTSIIFETDAE